MFTRIDLYFRSALVRSSFFLKTLNQEIQGPTADCYDRALVSVAARTPRPLCTGMSRREEVISQDDNHMYTERDLFRNGGGKLFAAPHCVTLSNATSLIISGERGRRSPQSCLIYNILGVFLSRARPRGCT